MSTTTSVDDILATLNHVKKQTIADQLELILIAPSKMEPIHIPEDIVNALFDVQVVYLDKFESTEKSFFEGTNVAMASIIVSIEDHVFPSEDWAEALLTAHRDGYDVVTTGMKNANPQMALSWGNMLLDYGNYLIPTQTGEVKSVPLHNVSFARHVIQYFGERLIDEMRRDGKLGEKLQEQGYRMYVSPHGSIAHINPSRLMSTVIVRIDSGRMYGAKRAELENWGVGKRLLYIVGAPLIPVVRFYRCWEQYFADGKRGEEMSRAVVGLIVCLILESVGEMMGYAVGTGKSAERLNTVDLVGRKQHIVSHDRQLLDSRE